MNDDNNNNGDYGADTIPTNIPKVENKMGVMPIGKLLFQMSLPPIISMLIQAMYNIVDSIFVAKVSEAALTGVTLVFPVQMLMISLNSGIGVGLSSLISRRLGEKNQNDANSAAAHGFFLAIMCWIAYALFGFFLTEPFMKLFTDDAEILRSAVIYCKFVTIGSIFMCISICIERVLQATGNMMYPMVFNAAGGIINTVLAPIFIVGYLGAPALGVTGAGAVAVFGQGVACIIALVLFLKKRHRVTVSFKKFKPIGRIIKDILVVGAPSIVMMSVGSFLIGGLNAILIAHSAVAVAVLGVYFRIQSFVFMPVIGLNQGALPVMGYNYGARNKVRLMAAYKLALKIALTIMIIGVAIFWIFSKELMLLFSASDEMLEMGVIALRRISLCLIPAAFTIVTVGMFQALAHGVFAMIISLIRQLVLLLPLAYILANNFGVNATWYAYGIAEIAAVILAALFLRKVMKTDIAQMPEVIPKR